ncbi:MAG: condensation domain-containing protein, partial [Pseudomonas sp.]
MQLPAHNDLFPVSAQQGAVLARQDRQGQSLAAFVQVSFTTAFDENRLRAVLDELLARHEILQTRYQRLDGMRRPVQCVAPQAAMLLRVERGTETLASVREALREALLEAPCAAVAKVEGDTAFSVMLAAPLASLDAGALAQLAHELQQGYASQLPAADADALQYIDYASWQGELAAEDIGVRGAAWWRGVRAGVGVRPRLPFERDGQVCTQLSHLSTAADAQ